MKNFVLARSDSAVGSTALNKSSTYYGFGNAEVMHTVVTMIDQYASLCNSISGFQIVDHVQPLDNLGCRLDRCSDLHG